MKIKHAKIAKDTQLYQSLKEQIHNKVTFSNSKKNRRLVAKFFLFAGILASLYSGLFKTEQLFVLHILYISFGIVTFIFALNFAHDLAHNTVFKSKKLNNFIYICIFTFTGANAQSWKHRHINSHHKAPNVKGFDIDLEITSLIRLEPHAPLHRFHRFQQIYSPVLYSIYSLYWFFIKDFKVLFSSLKSNTSTFIDVFIFLFQKCIYITYILILPSFFTHFSFYEILFAFVIMHLLMSIPLLFTFLITHHTGEAEYFTPDNTNTVSTSWFQNQIRSSNDFYPFSGFSNLIFGGFNNHIAHHLFPNINHIFYPEMNKIIYSFLSKNGFILSRTTFFTGIVKHIQHLKNMGSIKNKQ